MLIISQDSLGEKQRKIQKPFPLEENKKNLSTTTVMEEIRFFKVPFLKIFIYLVAPRLRWGMWLSSSLPGDQTGVPAHGKPRGLITAPPGKFRSSSPFIDMFILK